MNKTLHNNFVWGMIADYDKQILRLKEEMHEFLQGTRLAEDHSVTTISLEHFTNKCIPFIRNNNLKGLELKNFYDTFLLALKDIEIQTKESYFLYKRTIIAMYEIEDHPFSFPHFSILSIISKVIENLNTIIRFLKEETEALALPPQPDYSKLIWFKVGLLFATGEMDALKQKFNGSAAKIAGAISPENKSGYRPYISESFGIGKGVKNIFNSTNKLKIIYSYCQQNDIAMCDSFIAKYNAFPSP
jgi:hypothetical protein